MATIAEQIIKAVMQLNGNPPVRLTLPEAASQTFVKGEIVLINAAGYVAEIGDNPAQIYGVAAEDGHNSASAGDNTCSIFLATPDTLFEANVKQSGSNHVLAQTDIGAVMGLYRDTGDSKVYLDSDIGAGANVRVFVHKVARGTVIGDTNGRVLFNFLPNWIQFLGTS